MSKDHGGEKRTAIWWAPAPDASPEQCPCCGGWTLHSRGEYEICSVCGWEDDSAEEIYEQPAPERPLGPNRHHLWQARANARAFDFADERCAEVARREARRREFFSRTPPEPTH